MTGKSNPNFVGSGHVKLCENFLRSGQVRRQIHPGQKSQHLGGFPAILSQFSATQMGKDASVVSNYKNQLTENPLGVSTHRLKSAASSNPLLPFDLSRECALYSVERNSGRVRSVQRTTEKNFSRLGRGVSCTKRYENAWYIQLGVRSVIHLRQTALAPPYGC